MSVFPLPVRGHGRTRFLISLPDLSERLARQFPPSRSSLLFGIFNRLHTSSFSSLLLAPMSPSLLVSRLAKRFGDVQALSDVSFSVQPGERLALLGPNGAGKTTAVRCICGRVTPDEGEITLLGQTLASRSPRDGLGFVPQDLAIYQDLTTRENLEAFGRFHGLRGGQLTQAVKWALEWTGLWDRRNDPPKTFSGGMKRRVNMACGVLHRPQVVVLDEPTVGVDPQSRERIFGMLQELSADGTSILLTTHHLDEAETQCDRIVIMDHGRVIADGSLLQLVSSTIGTNRRVTVQLRQPMTSPNGFHLGAMGTIVHAEIGDVAAELPALLAQIHEHGGEIDDVEVRSPSLHSVFLHLTGRELRE